MTTQRKSIISGKTVVKIISIIYVHLFMANLLFYLADKHVFEGFRCDQLVLDELKHFLTCLRGDETPVVAVRDGAQSLRIALAARESLDRGNVGELK